MFFSRQDLNFHRLPASQDSVGASELVVVLEDLPCGPERVSRKPPAGFSGGEKSGGSGDLKSGGGLSGAGEEKERRASAASAASADSVLPASVAADLEAKVPILPFKHVQAPILNFQFLANVVLRIFFSNIGKSSDML